MYLVQMPERSTSSILYQSNPVRSSPRIAEVLAVPKNMKLLAIPLFELYDNAARYVLTVFTPILRGLRRFSGTAHNSLPFLTYSLGTHSRCSRHADF